MREVHNGKLVIFPRYAFSSENLDIVHLHKLKSQLPKEYNLRQMDVLCARQLNNEKSEFAFEHMLNFDSPEDFIERGFGFCVLYGDEVVSIATTFAICDAGIEIQIDTRKHHQNRGLATVVASQLLIYSLENNLDPNWDAANKKSIWLAKKLGYTPQGTYSVYILVRSWIKAIYGRLFVKIQQITKKL